MIMLIFIFALTLVAFRAGAWWKINFGLREAHFHGPHEHECQNCGNIWEHDDMMFPIGYYNEYVESEHICEECGAEVLEIT